MLTTTTFLFSSTAAAADSEPIEIDGNDQLAGYCSSGDGTVGNPYVIANLNIDASSSLRGIVVKNTDLYLTISNCAVTGAVSAGEGFGYGVWLFNCANVTVVDGDFGLNDIGVLVELSDNITIANNYLNASKYCGIGLDSSRDVDIVTNHFITPQYASSISMYMSSYCLVDGNDVAGQGLGVDSRLCHNCTISNNEIDAPAVYYLDPCLHVQLSQDIAILGNQITTPKAQGFYLRDSSRLTISGNGFTTPGDGNGIFISACDHLTIEYNDFIGSGSGIDMHDSDNSTLTNNNFDLVSFSIRSVFSDHITISYNDCSGGRYGECIELYGASNNTVSHNLISADGSMGPDMGGRGIMLTSNSIFNTVIENTITSGSKGIMVTSFSRYNNVSNNVISDAYYGIHVRPADVYEPILYNEVENNTISYCERGIYAEIAAYTIIANNTISDCETGIWIRSSTYTWVADNIVSNGDYGMILGPDGYIEPGPDQYVNVTRNTVQGITYTGIIANMIEDCSFWGNYIAYCGMDGIYLDGSYDNLVRANEIVDCTGNGVHGSFSVGDVITGNLLAGMGDAGICVEYCEAYSVIDNIIGFCENGIELYQAYNSVVAYNYIELIGYVGIILDDSWYNVIDQNYLGDFGESGIVIAYMPPMAITGLRFPDDISGNVITNNTIESESDVGIGIYSASGNLVRNNTIDGCANGIYLEGTMDNIILYNNVTVADCGIYLYDADENVVRSNNLTYIYDVCIQLEFSSGNVVENNVISEFNEAGILIGESGLMAPMSEYEYGSSYNIVSGNSITGGSFGIVMESCSFNAISDNEIIDPYYVGVLVFGSYVNTITVNIIWGEMEVGIVLVGCAENTVQDNSIQGALIAVVLDGSDGNIIAGNDIQDISCGIEIYSSWFNIVRENTITPSEGDGIYVEYGGGNTIVGNIIDSPMESGISLYMSEGDRVYGNTVIDAWWAGIDLDTCTADLQGNTLVNCGIMLSLDGVVDQAAYSSSMVILSNNTVNGLPVLLIKDADLAGESVASGQGEIILLNVTRAVVSGQAPAYGGIIVAFSDNITVTGNSIVDALIGVHIVGSENCTISNNAISMEAGTRGLWSSIGILVELSSYLTIEGNDVVLSFASAGPVELDWSGIRLYDSDHNVVSGNTVRVSATMPVELWMEGIFLYCSNDNEVSRNELSAETAEPFFGNGIGLYSSDRNQLLWNNISDMPQVGMLVDDSDGNTVAGNRIFRSGSYGIEASGSYFNHIHGNILAMNNGTSEMFDASRSQAYDDGTNWWNSTCYGNYWEDLTAPDSNWDGIIDIPYPISGGAADPWPVWMWLNAEWPAEWPNYTRIMTTALNGEALDGFGITQVTWYNEANGASGVCTGTTAWDTGTVPLLVGDNIIWIMVHDQAGHVFEYAHLVVCSPGPIPDEWPSSTVYDKHNPFQFWLNLTDIAPMASGNWSVFHDGALIAHGSISGLEDTMEFRQLMSWMVLPGVNTIRVQINDTVGNVAVLTMTVFFDEVDPTVVIDWPANGYINSTGAVEIVAHASDDLSGIEHYLVRLDNGQWVPMGATAPFSGLSDGGHTVTVRAVDRCGNTKEVSVTFTVDTTAPALSITSPADGALLNEASVTAEWTVTDATTGLASVHVRIDGGAWLDAMETSEWSFSTLAQGSHTVELRAVDNAGNEALAAVDIVIDTVAPVTIADVTGPAGSNGWYVGEVSVELQATDAVSGVANIYCRVNGGAWTVYTSALAFSTDGVYMIEFNATDVAGNVETTHSLTVRIDATVPELEIISPANNAWVLTDDVVPELSSSDAMSGIAAFNIKVDGGAWSTDRTAAQVVFLGLSQGEHTLWVRAIDNAGNIAVTSVTVKIDSVAPVIENWTSGTGVQVGGPIDFEFSEAMNTTSVTFAISGGVTGTVTWSGQNARFTPTADLAYNTTYTVTVTGKDIAGNSMSKTWTFTTTNLGGLSGTVTGPDGSPVGGVTVTLSNGMTATTDSEGRFAFTDVEAGNYALTVSGSSYATATQTVTVSPGEDSVLETVSLQAAPTDPGSGPLDVGIIAAVVAVLAVVAVVAFVVVRNRKN